MPSNINWIKGSWLLHLQQLTALLEYLTALLKWTWEECHNASDFKSTINAEINKLSEVVMDQTALATDYINVLGEERDLSNMIITVQNVIYQILSS